MWQALFLWITVLVGSVALAEIPAIGNLAVLLATETNLETAGVSGQVTVKISHELVAYDPDQDEFTIERFAHGTREQWQSAKENLVNKIELERKLSRCTNRKGTFIPAHKVQAGVFPACKFRVVSDDGEGEYYTGVVPFGMLEYNFRTLSGTLTRYELFDFKE